MDIFQKRGDREKIGEKRVLVFHSSGSKSKSAWVMHEYVATFLPPTDHVKFLFFSKQVLAFSCD